MERAIICMDCGRWRPETGAWSRGLAPVSAGDVSHGMCDRCREVRLRRLGLSEDEIRKGHEAATAVAGR